jgi:hypothetical protein
MSNKFDLMLSQKSIWPTMSLESKKIALSNFDHSKIFHNLINSINDHQN